MKKQLFRSVAMIVLVVFSVGCASTTLINSNPQDAALFFDGVEVGSTPFTHTDTDIAMSSKQVELKKQGYDVFRGMIKRDRVNTMNLVLSLLCFLPAALWAWEYPPAYNFTLASQGAIMLEQMMFDFTPATSLEIAELN